MTVDEIKDLIRKKIEGIDREIMELNSNLNRHTAIRVELLSILEQIDKGTIKKA